jgi:hypothetical protein
MVELTTSVLIPQGTAATKVVDVEVKVRKKKKRVSSSRASGGDFGEPLTASTPVRAENGDKPKRKKRPSSHLSASAEGTVSDVTEDSTNVSKSSLKKTARSTTTSGVSEESKVKSNGKKTKKSSNASLTDNSTAKKSTSSDVTHPEVKTVQVEMNDIGKDEQLSPPQEVSSIRVDGVDDSYEMERSARSRRSSSPKSRYRMGEVAGEEIEKEKTEKKKSKVKTSEKGGEAEKGVSKKKVGKKKSKKAGDGERDTATNGAEKVGKKKSKVKSTEKDREAENSVVTKEKVSKKRSKAKESEKEEEKVTVGVIAKDKGAKKKPKDEDKKKKRKSKEESSSRKVSKEELSYSSRKVSAAEKEIPPTVEEHTEEPLSLSVDAMPPQSAAISGSIESNTLTFVSGKKGGSKSSLNETEEEEVRSKKNNTLPRSKSTDYSRRSSASDTSDFRNELREASRSQHDMPEAVNSSMTIEIDPHIKVKKSGIVKGKTPVRPSIFDQSSSPEPEEIVPISSGPIEDNLLDPEFKVKKSGIVQGRKTSATSRPSILDEKETKKSPDGKL